MATEKKAASPAARFARPTKLIELPNLAADGEPLFVRVRGVSATELVPILGGMPAFAPPADGAPLSPKAQAEQLERIQRIACAGIVEPPFVFEGEAPEGVAAWRDLSAENQVFIAAEVVGLSGFGMGLPAGAAAVATFPAGEPGGGSDGGGADGAVPDAAAPVPGAAGAAEDGS